MISVSGWPGLTSLFAGAPGQVGYVHEHHEDVVQGPHHYDDVVNVLKEYHHHSRVPHTLNTEVWREGGREGGREKVGREGRQEWGKIEGREARMELCVSFVVACEQK